MHWRIEGMQKYLLGVDFISVQAFLLTSLCFQYLTPHFCGCEGHFNILVIIWLSYISLHCPFFHPTSVVIQATESLYIFSEVLEVMKWYDTALRAIGFFHKYSITKGNLMKGVCISLGPTTTRVVLYKLLNSCNSRPAVWLWLCQETSQNSLRCWPCKARIFLR